MARIVQCQVVGLSVITTWGKEPLGRPRCRWEDNITMYLHEGVGEVRNGLIWLWIGTGSGLLW